MGALITEQHIAFAHEMADAARDITLKYFRSGLTVEVKDDHSPVTRADRETEALMRDMITARFPAHGICGEEYGDKKSTGSFCWTLDPIDGTRSFVIGKPLFGTLIALAHNGRPHLGMIDMPALNERWLGVYQRGATFNALRCHTSDCDTLTEATLLATSPDMFTPAERRPFDALSKAVRFRSFGTDCYGYGLLACGFADIVMEAGLAAHDVQALVPVVEEAGGCISDWHGRPWSAALNDATDNDQRYEILATANCNLHAQVLDIIAGQDG